MKGLFVGGIPLALLAAAAQAQFDGAPGDVGAPGDAALPFLPQPGATVLGGPSGNDDGDGVGSFTPKVHTHSGVNEWSEDDHSIDVKDKNVYPPPVPWEEAVPFPEGPGPVVPGLGPFKKRHWPSGGTAIGGPSGNDEGQSFNMPITGNFHTDINEFNKDDHSIRVKNKDIHPPPFLPPGPPPFAGGAPPFASAPDFDGPPEREFGGTPDAAPFNAFGKRHWGPKNGGTVIGGPSGNDDGINAGSPVTVDTYSEVNEWNKDDHSIHVKHKDVFPPAQPEWGFPYKRHWDPEEWGPQEGGTALGGPSGNDGGQSFSAPITVNTHTGVNEHWEDNHAINVKDKHVYPPPPLPPLGAPEFGGSGFPGPELNAPPSFEAPSAFEPAVPMSEVPAAVPEAPAPAPEAAALPHKAPAPAPKAPAPAPKAPAPAPEAPVSPEPAATPDDASSAPAAPAQDQFGETIPEGGITPFRSGADYGDHRRAYTPDSSRTSSSGDQNYGQNDGQNAGQNGADGGPTVEGGPSGNDGGIGFSGGASVSTDSHVNEHHQDNHAINADVTHVHPPPEVYSHPDVYPVPGTPFDFPPSGLEEPAFGPPSGEMPPTFKSKSNPPLEEVDHAPDCAASVHEVVRTVTKTHYREVEKTATVYEQRPATSMIVETSAIPMAAVPQPSYVPEAEVYSNPALQPSMETVVAIPAPSSMVPVYSYDHKSHRPVTKGVAYSMIPVDVPVYSSRVMGSSTPVASKAVPTGVSPEFSASASASPSAHAQMFTGDAARLSGGLLSVAAAVMGVLAFVL